LSIMSALGQLLTSSGHHLWSAGASHQVIERSLLAVQFTTAASHPLPTREGSALRHSALHSLSYINFAFVHQMLFGAL
jgi:hypothetical protein